MRTATQRPIAVIGMACLLPGASSPDEFWQHLLSDADLRTPGGPDEFGTDPGEPGGWGDDAHRITETRGGFVTEPEIDLTGLHVPPDELARLDRVVRWPLHVTRQALADAGIELDDPVLARTGLALGNYSFPTEESVRMSLPLHQEAVSEGLRRAGIEVPPHESEDVEPHNLWAAGLPATVLADAFALGGPAWSLDAACSSALYSLALARDQLTTGRADVMLAGAVCAPDPLLIHLSFSDLQAYPDNGVSQPFDDGSRGIVTGQGAGVFVLKRLADAERDGDRIHAVIDAIGLSNDGAGKHVLSPNLAGQIEAYRRAYDDSGIHPSTVDYVECHATGTPLGDSTELRGLEEFFVENAGQVPPLGSVKANVGHLLTVAGFSSALKVILAMRHGIIPATPGVREPLRVPECDQAPQRVVRSQQPWPDSEHRRAGVSAFGFGGTNAHVVFSASASSPAAEPAQPGPLSVVGLGVRLGPLSGKDELAHAVRTATPVLGERPDQRWYGIDDLPEVPDTEGGHVDTVDVDVRAYRIPPAELGHANPQHLVFFEAADEALADAGFTTTAGQEPRRVATLIAMDMEPHTHAHRARFDIGAHVRSEIDRAGVQLGEKDLTRLEDAARRAIHPDLGANEVLSYIGNVMASRVCAAHNFTGPSFTISSDSAAGAVALEIAGLLLLDPTIEAVLVGGVDLAAGAENTLARQQLAEGADSVPPLGDGAAAVVVMRPQDVPDGRRVYATVEAVGSHRGEDSVGRAARDGLRAAGLDASDVDYLEIGGLTAASSAAEIGGLADVYRTVEDTPGCVVGRLGDLTGDVQRASVLAALVKVALFLHRAEFPAAPETLTVDDTRFRVPSEPVPWLRHDRNRPRTAAISAIGHHGPRGWHAAHLILSGASERGREVEVDWQNGGPLLLPVRADDGPGLAQRAGDLLDQLRSGADPHRLVRSEQGELTAVLVAPDAAGLERELEAAQRDLQNLDGEWSTPSGSCCTAEPIGAEGKVAFVYPGAFTTYPGAGRDLFRLFPGLLAQFEDHEEHPVRRFKLDALYPMGTRRLDRSELMHHETKLIEDIPAVLATGTNLAVLTTQLLRDVLGLKPHGAFGYSLGESSMLFATGVWAESARDDAALVATPLFRDQLCGRKEFVRQAWNLPDDTADKKVWSTHVLLAAAQEVQDAIAELDRVWVTHINTPGEVVIAGDPEQCAEVIARAGCKAARAPANHVMHCPLIHPVLDGLTELNSYPLGQPDLDVELLSAYNYDRIGAPNQQELAEHIAGTLCGTIDFVRLVETAHDRGFRYFVEVGPGATCTRWIGETLTDKPHVAVSVDRRGASTGVALAAALARLVSHGLPIDLSVLFGTDSGDQATGRLTVPVVCGAESVVQQVRTAAEAVVQHEEQPMPAAEHHDGVDEIVVDGDPFVHLRPKPVEVTARRIRPPVRSSVKSPVKSPVRALVGTVAEAHRAALRAHDAVQQRMLDQLVPQGRDQAIWNEADLLEFATGSVAKVFGARFEEVDGFAYRVRLPAPPYLFVSRVTELKARTGRFEPSAITTEYDVPADAWYLVDGVAPTAITVEAGQCDLMLISYLGIDFETRGHRVYRLLDSTLVFHGGFPRAGQTLRYEINIDRFVRNGDTLLFFFNYQCFADGELILALHDACAGFFTAGELDDSLGVVTSEADRKRREAMTRTWFKPLERTDRTSLSTTDLDLLADGKPAEVFGERWDQSADGCNPSIRLPHGRLRMIDEITRIDRLGGPRGLGALSAVTNLDPDGWYFACHFTGDPVLAGSLVAEGGVQLLQVYAMYLGLHLVLPDAEFQPVPGLRTTIKVRGQITPETAAIRYEAEIIEITMLPRPTLVADLVIYDGDKPIISIHDFGIRLREKPGTPYRPGPGGVPPFFGRRNHTGEQAFVNELHLAHAAKGDLDVAMGPEFEIYRELRAPYIPNGDFRFVDRVMRLDGTRRKLVPGATMDSEYDAPPEAWYFHENPAGDVPNCVLMETSLQAAIFLGYYLGATLDFPDTELSIRNLDGRATLVRDLDLRGRTIRHHSEMLSSQSVKGVVLQNFRYELSADGEVFYTGESLFGYFTDEALSNQVGLDNGTCVPPWLDQQSEADTIHLELDDRWFTEAPALGDGHLRLVNELDIVVGGGEHGKGYVRGTRTISPDDWYFDCHFHRDPVMPGSLGVEAIIQGLQVFIRETGLADGIPRPVFTTARDVEMAWRYRGQILRTDPAMTFDLHVREVRRQDDSVVVIADASLWRTSGLRIYELTGIAVEVRPGEEEQR
ncbi:beta-ketoacyl synthase N-terminal-like domain-containing protein [Lentzea kentuckyensis]|uniref:beta-ketoacyl synthase N-terminal-like domain-containing protein n=1 Tax=Lentzea kentuckyensis TaxID=360086 RepID=UPI000A360A56|nr:beta-ketoacyl synthase N-terminal-like domain-containing protein [Lentzea kentuckyensis]